MKCINKIVSILLSISMLIGLTSCAAGAATAGYALKAQSADSLTAEAEQRIINRAKSEIIAEFPIQHFSVQPVCSPIPE